MRKKASIVFGIITFLFILWLPLEPDEQDQHWFYSVLKCIYPDSPDKIPGRLGLQTFSENADLSRVAIHNINRHMEEVIKLRAQGVPESEILSRFKPIQTTGATGSISGRVYVRSLEDHEYSISVRAFDEYGIYAGYDYISASDWYGSYTIDNLSPGKYYVRAGSYGCSDMYYPDTTDWRKAKLVKVKKN